MSRIEGRGDERDHAKGLLEEVGHELVGVVELADEGGGFDIGERVEEEEVLGKVRLLGRGEVLELAEEELENVLERE